MTDVPAQLGYVVVVKAGPSTVFVVGSFVTEMDALEYAMNNWTEFNVMEFWPPDPKMDVVKDA